MGVQRAGFEPANHYGLGPHPSAFDQAGQPLQRVCHPTRVYQQARRLNKRLNSKSVSRLLL